MSLSRLALRLATVEALRPSAQLVAGGPWPTLAGRYVFDTRLTPLDDLQPQERRPVAVIYTDDDDGEGGQKAGGPPFKRTMDLCAELSMMMLGADPDDPGTMVPGVPASDAELEAQLDLFEAQVRFVLFYGPTGRLWRDLTGRRVATIKSVPHRGSEEAVPLAVRGLKMAVQIPDDCIDGAPASIPQGLDRLPEPLKSVVAALAKTSYGAVIAQAIAIDAPLMPVPPLLKTVALDVEEVPAGQAQTGEPNMSGAATDLDQPQGS